MIFGVVVGVVGVDNNQRRRINNNNNKNNNKAIRKRRKKNTLFLLFEKSILLLLLLLSLSLSSSFLPSSSRTTTTTTTQRKQQQPQHQEVFSFLFVTSLSIIHHPRFAFGGGNRRKTNNNNNNNNLSKLNMSSNNNKKNKNYVIIGGGIQGTSVAYHIAKRLEEEEEEEEQQQQEAAATATVDDTKNIENNNTHNYQITILESTGMIGSAASGKGGGFMARSWGDGTSTEQLHHVGFDMYETLSKELHCTSYRKLPVLSVKPTTTANRRRKKNEQQEQEYIPNWLDGEYVGNIDIMGNGDDTAQITPSEVVQKMLSSSTIQLLHGTCTGIETTIIEEDEADDEDDEEECRYKVTGVKYQVDDGDDDTTTATTTSIVLPADVVIISAGPWSCIAEDWFQHSQMRLPMQGIKSTGIVWKKPTTSTEKNDNNDNDDDVVDATALFCGEHHRYNTHLEVYPRPNGEIYICGVGGSQYISEKELKLGIYRSLGTCTADPLRVNAATESFYEISNTYKMNGVLDRIQSCMRPCPPDALPYMGKIPLYKGAYINAGHNCWGIAWAPACGLAMADLIMDNECNWIDLEPFYPDRFRPDAFQRKAARLAAKKKKQKQEQETKGTRGRKRQQTDVGEQW